MKYSLILLIFIITVTGYSQNIDSLNTVLNNLNFKRDTLAIKLNILKHDYDEITDKIDRLKLSISEYKLQSTINIRSYRVFCENNYAIRTAANNYSPMKITIPKNKMFSVYNIFDGKYLKVQYLGISGYLLREALPYPLPEPLESQYNNHLAIYLSLIDSSQASILTNKSVKEKKATEPFENQDNKPIINYLPEIDTSQSSVLTNKSDIEKKALIAKYGYSFAEKIFSKKISLGMTTDMVEDSWGKPKDINRTYGSLGVLEQWIYGSLKYRKYVYFKNGKLTSWQD